MCKRPFQASNAQQSLTAEKPKTCYTCKKLREAKQERDGRAGGLFGSREDVQKFSREEPPLIQSPCHSDVPGLRADCQRLWRRVANGPEAFVAPKTRRVGVFGFHPHAERLSGLFARLAKARDSDIGEPQTWETLGSTKDTHPPVIFFSLYIRPSQKGTLKTNTQKQTKNARTHIANTSPLCIF